MPETYLSPLTLLKEPLEDLEYSVVHESVNSENLVEKLFISLEIEGQPAKRQFIIELFFVNDVLEAFAGPTEEDDDGDETIMAQFNLVLPVSIPTQSYGDIMRVINLINRLTPLGAFGLSEDDGAIYLRYSLAAESREIPEALLLQVVSAFEYLSLEYTPIFEAMVEGTSSAQEFIDSFEKSGNPIPSVGNPKTLGA